MKLVELLLEIGHPAVEYHNDVITRLVTQGTHLFGVLGAGLQDAINILQENYILPPQWSLDSDCHLTALHKEMIFVTQLGLFHRSSYKGVRLIA
jgi:hypothetical protein